MLRAKKLTGAGSGRQGGNLMRRIDVIRFHPGKYQRRMAKENA
jgi:hypothetical protein